MKWLSNWFLDNPVAANLLMAFILIAGFLSLNTIRVESFPQIEPTQLTVSVVYPGATPEQIDEGVTQRIENAISGIAGIKTIVSESRQGYAIVRIKKNTGVKLDSLVDDVRNQVEAIVGFPEGAERPRIVPDKFTNLANFVIVHGVDDVDVLQQSAIKVEQALKKHPAISEVSNLGKRKQQLVVQPDKQALQRLGLSPELLAEKITQWSLLYRSGELKTGAGTITLRGDGYADKLLKLRQLPIITTSTGVVLLQDIARVTRGYEQNDGIVRFAGKPAIALMISTSTKDNLLQVSEATQAVLHSVQTALPGKVETAMMADMAPYITEQLDLLSTNAWQGLLIILIILGIFLEVKLAFWVALGIPISLAGAIWLMDLPYFDYSINDITLFGMILVLGILVDDAVVVGESIHSARKKHADPKQAARVGVQAVATATTFGVLTTIAAFSPMLWIENELAKLLAGFSAVVIFALIFSLIESKLILPSHLSSKNKKDIALSLTDGIAKVRAHCQAGLAWFSDNVYEPLLVQSLKHKISALLVFVTIMLIAYGSMAKGLIPSVFFPEIPGRYGTLTVTMDKDAAIELTVQEANKIEAAVYELKRSLGEQYQLSEPAIENYLLAVEGARQVELTIEISRSALETIPSEEILSLWKQYTGIVEGSYATQFTLADQPAGATAITVSADDKSLAIAAAKEIRQILTRLPGVESPYDDSQSGNRQLQVTLNPRGIQLGVKQRDLAVLVGGAYGELELHRLLEQGEEVSVIVQFPEAARKNISQLRSTPVMLPDGSYINLGEIVDFEYSRQADVMYRRNRDSVVSIYWRQNRNIAAPEQIWQQLQDDFLPGILQKYPGARVEAVGEFAEIEQVQEGFKKAMLLTLLLIYVLLAVPLKSYFQPLIIMAVIPFGFAGAIYGHAIMGLQVSILSLFGMMAMTGVVVNDSLVLMTRFNQLYRDGVPLVDALVQAGKSRMQAIFLTTVTTVFGLLPLLAESSETAQYLKPAAVSLVFGELLATPITLVLIPVMLAMGKRFRERTAKPVANTTEQLGVAKP